MWEVKCITAFHSLEYPSGLTKAEVMRRAHRQSRIQSLTLKISWYRKNSIVMGI